MGGAIFNMQGTLTIDDSTIEGNTALGGADNVKDSGKGIGGAVFNLSGQLAASGSTFAFNTAEFYGAQIYNLVYDGHQPRTAQTVLRDTIVADGLGAPFDLTTDKTGYIYPSNQGTTVVDVSQFDLVRTMNAQEAGTPAIVGSPLTGDPLLGPLQSNGGPTDTMALMSGSPAIDAGDPGCLDLMGMPLGTDQRGALRPAGAACDLGAVELATPGAATGAVTAVSTTAAILNGAATNPDLGGGSIYFQYGLTSAYGATTPAQAVGPRTSGAPFSASVGGLAAHSTYHFRAVVTNAVGTAYGADQVFSTAAPAAGGPTGSGPGLGGLGAALAAVGRVTVSPIAFAAAPSGPSAVAAARRRYGTTVTYTLNQPATVRFTVLQPQSGRRAKGGRCVKPTRANRRARRCVRMVTLAGSFTRTGRAGTNRFRFTGRLAGRKLKPGSYQLVATPSAAGKVGRASRAAFRVIR